MPETTEAYSCANCGSPEMEPYPSNPKWLKCMNCRTLNAIKGENTVIVKEKDIPKAEIKEQEELAEVRSQQEPYEMTLSDKIGEIVLKIILFVFAAFLLRSCWKANYYDINLDSLGRYEIPPITCPNNEAVIVTFGYFGEEPLLYSHVSGQWQISETIRERIKTEGVYSSYVWVYCDNAEKDPRYTTKGNGSFNTLPRPEDGLKIVIRGAEPKP